MKFKKGFTLIELLVVIAIIGILSSVVLASLTTARTKGKDAAVESQLSSMRAQAELYYSTTGNNSYGSASVGPSACSTASSTANTVFNGTNSLTTLINATYTGGASAASCVSSGSAWSVVATIPSGTFYCVDNQGQSKATTSAAANILGC